MFLPVLFQSSSTKELKPSQGSTMLLALLPVLGIHFLLREAQAQSVTQPDAHVTVSEAASLQLRCKYSSSVAPYLFWYVQYPRQGLQLLLKYYSGDPVVHGLNGFEAEFSKSDSSFHLQKASVHWSDSAVYFCALSAQCVGLQGELNTNTHGRGCSDLSLWSLWHLFGLGEEKRKLSSPSPSVFLQLVSS